jgi:hypothetical protein
MFLSSIESTTGGLRTPWLIWNDRRRLPNMHGCKTKLPILANPCFNQVASVIIITHGHKIPCNDHFTRGKPSILHILRRIIELCIREECPDLGYGVDITIQFQHLYTHPAVILVGPWINIHPSSFLISSQ